MVSLRWIDKFNFLNKAGFGYLVFFVLFSCLFDPVRARYKQLDGLFKQVAGYPVFFRQGAVPRDPRLLWRTRQYYQSLIENLPAMLRDGRVKNESLTRAESHAMIGFSYYYLNNLDKAAEHYQQAIHDQESFAGHYFNLGLIYYRKGDAVKAAENFQQAVALSYNKIIYYAANPPDTDRGAHDFRQSRDIYNVAKRYLLFSAEKLGRFQNILMIAALPREEGTPRDDIFYSYYAGKAAARLGDCANAAIHLKKCLDLAPWHADAYAALAHCYRMSGRPALADRMVQQAQVMGTNPDFKRYVANYNAPPPLFLSTAVYYRPVGRND